jgi:hypothetical protein
MDIVLSDPTYVPEEKPGLVARFALRFIHDPRDLGFVRLSAILTATVIPTGVILFVPGYFRWWLAALHVALVTWFMGPFILMLHNTSHRRLFKAPYGWMNAWIPWLIGPFFGESPETYFAHHVGMHHPENNLATDLSSTMGYVRDSARDFARYFLRFFFFVLFDLCGYLAERRRRALLVRCLVGEFSFVALVCVLMFVDWRASLVVFVAPFLFTRFAMMAGNWAQHAFLDESAPENSYKNSITCINCGYNRRCFNDGYHIGHHLKQTRHWTEMPEDFRRNLSTYASEGALVFEGIDFFGIWFLLMLRRYDALARRVVQLGGARLSEAELIALLQKRTRWTRVPAREDEAAHGEVPAAR